MRSFVLGEMADIKKRPYSNNYGKSKSSWKLRLPRFKTSRLLLLTVLLIFLRYVFLPSLLQGTRLTLLKTSIAANAAAEVVAQKIESMEKYKSGFVTTNEESSNFISTFINFAPDPKHENTTFADFAFQTSIYKNILISSNFPQLIQKEFETNLYSFIPGLEKLRISQGLINSSFIESNDLNSITGSTWPRRTRTRKSKQQKDDHSQGIVVVTSDRHFTYTVQLIATLREGHKCDLPIEVYFYGEDDLKVVNRNYLERTFKDVKAINLEKLGLFDENFVGLHNGGWAMKPFALLASSFKQAILVDADTIFLADPHDFFEHEEFKKTGTLFFHDRFLPTWHNKKAIDFIREEMKNREPSHQLSQSLFWRDDGAHYMESGLVVMDKSNPNVFAGLLFTCWQNSRPVRDDTTYLMFHGDKESYWLSMELAGLPYSFSPYWAGAIGPEHSDHHEGFCPDHQLHFFDSIPNKSHKSIEGNSLKNHNRRPAWVNGSLLKNKLHGHEDELLDLKNTLFADDGRWVFKDSGHGSTFCLEEYTRRTAEDVEMDSRWKAMLLAGQDATLELVESRDIEE